MILTLQHFVHITRYALRYTVPQVQHLQEKQLQSLLCDGNLLKGLGLQVNIDTQNVVWHQ